MMLVRPTRRLGKIITGQRWYGALRLGVEWHRGFDTIDMNILMGDTAAFMSAYIGSDRYTRNDDECTDLLGMLRAMHMN